MPAEQDLTLNDLSILAERCDLECKAAQGRVGFLGSESIGRGIVCFLSSQHFPQRGMPDMADERSLDSTLAPELAGLSPEPAGLTPELSPHPANTDRLPPELSPAWVTDLAELDEAHLAVLRALALPVIIRTRPSIRAVCRNIYKP